MTRGVIVIGSGGHAKVCIELLRASGRHVSYCVAAPGGEATCLGVPALHGDENLSKLRGEGYEEAFVALGPNGLRQRLAALATGLGFRLVNAISPQAVVSPSAKIGQGVAIMAGAVINADSVISDLAIINTLASVDHDGQIGEAAHIAPHSALAGNVTVGTRSFLGVGCKVIPEVSIGSDVVAGAGSVIIKDIQSNSRIAGVPAKALPKGS